LRGQGHDVLSIRQVARGTPDPDVLRIASETGRILLTADKDFGELVFRQGLVAAGIMLLRFRTASRTEFLDRFMQHFPDIARAAEGHFVVATNHALRIRTLPRT
jgi:predicted nuclease of predicted toxin-antitoxin system